MVNFLDKFLTYVKECVTEDDSESVYKFEKPM